jgi:hypothetical protein
MLIQSSDFNEGSFSIAMPLKFRAELRKRVPIRRKDYFPRRQVAMLGQAQAQLVFQLKLAKNETQYDVMAANIPSSPNTNYEPNPRTVTARNHLCR